MATNLNKPQEIGVSRNEEFNSDRFGSRSEAYFAYNSNKETDNSTPLYKETDDDGKSNFSGAKQDSSSQTDGTKQDADNQQNSEGLSDESKDRSGNSKTYKDYLLYGGAALAVGGAAVVAAPIAIAAVGFGSGGIVAGSAAAGMMSSAATTGVGMGVVSALQSAGAAGLALSTQGVIGVAGASIGAGATKFGRWCHNKIWYGDTKSGEDKNQPKKDDITSGKSSQDDVASEQSRHNENRSENARSRLHVFNENDRTGNIHENRSEDHGVNSSSISSEALIAIQDSGKENGKEDIDLIFDYKLVEGMKSGKIPRRT